MVKTLYFVALILTAIAMSLAMAHLFELVAFWGFIFPVNQATQNWTALPDNWETLRSQWEYARAVRAILYVLALGTPLMSVLDWRCGVAERERR